MSNPNPAWETTSERQARANVTADLALRAAARRGQLERVEAVVANWRTALPVSTQAEWGEWQRQLAECANDIRAALEIPDKRDPDTEETA